MSSTRVNVCVGDSRERKVETEDMILWPLVGDAPARSLVPSWDRMKCQDDAQKKGQGRRSKQGENRAWSSDNRWVCATSGDAVGLDPVPERTADNTLEKSSRNEESIS